MITDILQFAQIMGRNQYGRPALCNLGHQDRPDLFPHNRIKTIQRFIQNQKFRSAAECQPECNLFLHSLGQSADIAFHINSREKLLQAEFSPELVEDAIAYVKSYGYVNDARYARTYISFRMESKSRQKILSELQMKGVDRQTALEAWEEMEELMEPDERAVLRKTIEKKYAPDTELDEGQMRRLYGYLARRAFKYEDISHTLDEMNIRVKHEME